MEEKKLSLGRIEMQDNETGINQSQMYRVLFKSGQERTLQLTPQAVKYYQSIGVQVTPIESETQLTDVSIRLRNVERNQSQIGLDAIGFGLKNEEQDVQLTQFRSEFDNAKIQRDSNMLKIEELFSGQQNIFDSVSQKADKSHTHANGGGTEKCEWWNIGCKLEDFQSDVGKFAIIGGLGIVAFFVLKKRIGF